MELLFDFLFILGVILCLSFIFILYKNNDKIELPHKILISLLFIFVFTFLSAYASINKLDILSIFTIPVVLSAKVFIPTLLFFYIKSLFFEDEKILEEHKVVLVFPAFFLLGFIVPCSILDSIYGLSYLLNYSENLHPVYEVILLYRKVLNPIRILSNIVAIVYLIVCLVYFFKLKEVMKSTYSYIGSNNFIWVRFLLIFPLIMVFVDSVFIVFEHFFFLDRWHNTEIYTSTILVMSVLGMGYHGLKQTKIFVPYFLLENSESKTDEKVLSKEENYKTQTNIEFESLEQKLKNTFVTEQLFLNTDLTLGKLAEAIGTTDKKISILLNQHLQISFYEYVNGFRIEAFKQALKNNTYKDYTIEAISKECGFKSKASFYRVFKSKMKMSPSEYKNSIS